MNPQTFVSDIMKFPQGLPEILHIQEWDECEVIVTSTSDHQIQSVHPPYLKKFPHVAGKLCSQECDRQFENASMKINISYQRISFISIETCLQGN